MSLSCKIKAKSSEDIFDSFSKCLKVNFEKSNNEYVINIPKKIGSGSIKGYQFSYGINVLMLEVELKNSLELVFEIAATNPLSLLFNETSPLQYNAKYTDLPIGRMQRLIFSNSVSDNHGFIIKKNKPASIFVININRKQFEEKIDSFVAELSQDLTLLLRDLNGVNFFYNADYYSLDVSNLIEEFKDCELEELMKPIFLEGKTYGILTNQLQKYTDNLDRKTDKKHLRKSTVEKIHKAVALIKEELETTIKVHKLAKRVGLNQNTLQSGFKTLYHTSVNDYIKNRRLEMAKTMIENTELNITEITYSIGINSRSYFSKLFKERYDINPKEYLLQVRQSNKSA